MKHDPEVFEFAQKFLGERVLAAYSRPEMLFVVLQTKDKFHWVEATDWSGLLQGLVSFR